MFSGPAVALQIDVQALFDGAAMLSIDGRSILLKKGSVSEEGVSLISADSKQAVIAFKGERRTLLLSEHISANFEEPSSAQVQIIMSDNRQYLTYGSINGRSTRFLVDTGANVVAINSLMARSLGISLESGVLVNASTASEDVVTIAVTIDQIQGGDIKAYNVQAVIVEGSNPKDILLGMSFLQHVNINENAGLMTLTSKM